MLPGPVPPVRDAIAVALTQLDHMTPNEEFSPVQQRVNFIYDGLGLTPLEYAKLLYACADVQILYGLV